MRDKPGTPTAAGDGGGAAAEPESGAEGPRLMRFYTGEDRMPLKCAKVNPAPHTHHILHTHTTACKFLHPARNY